eukprot:Skav218919  [mRNA]  locus=scaffold328:663736:665142:+ [translate_table: standard]
MAFAAVSGSVVTAVMQTEPWRLHFGLAQRPNSEKSGVFELHCLDVATWPIVSLAPWARVSECHASQSHGCAQAVAAVLVLVLSFKDWRVALVAGDFVISWITAMTAALPAGLNCFLPSIMADFAKYAVCFLAKWKVQEALGMSWKPKLAS